MNDCLFCKIIRKEVDAHLVYEDDDVIAFLDINPVNPGHTLVVPKKHVEQMLEMSDESCLPVMRAVKKIIQALMEHMGYEGANIVQNNYAAAGQVIPHVHFHVIPRKTGDGHRHWPGIAYERGEAAMVAEKIRAGLQ